MQAALKHSPGNFSGFSVWSISGDPPRSISNGAIARLMSESERTEGVHLLVALRINGHLSDLLPKMGPGGKLPSTQADLIVQVAAETREGMLWGMRRPHDVLAGVFSCQEEIVGGKIGTGREPFGFSDGLRIPTGEEIEHSAVVREGPLRGGSWVLYLRFQSNLGAFFRQRERDQERVFGINRDDQPLSPPPPNAHVELMKQFAKPGNYAFIRRGFPFRQTQEEGITFVAISSAPGHFARALEKMVGHPDGTWDALLDFVKAVSGGLYFAPPHAKWLATFGGESN